MQRLFTYNIQTKVGSNLNRYTYVLNNPLKYTDPNDYAYYGYGGPNASAGVMQNRCLISQQIEDFETRRSAFLSNQWHDVTLFDMIGDRGGAVSGNYSTPAPVPISYVWVNDYSVDDEQTFTITAKKLFYTDYFKGAALNSFLNNDFTPYYQVAQGQGGYSGDNIFLETWVHYQIGGHKDLNVSTSSLDFSFVSQKNLAYNSKDNTYSVNLFSLNKFSQTSLALGKVSLNSIGNNRYTINRDYYDFNIEWSQGFSTRNIGTFGAGLIHGPVVDNIPVPLPIFPLFGPSVYTGSGPYWINFNGSVYIKP